MQTNGVQIENTPNIIVITDSDANQITVTQPITSVIEVGAVGPQGPKGLPGDNIFTLVSASTYATTSSLIVTGSLTVSGSSTFTNIGPAIFSGSVTSTQGFTGSLFGTSSYAITASYALNGGSGGGGFYIATGSVSASVSLGTGSFTITSGSSNFVFVSSSGNVGIGTTTPFSRLHIKNSAPSHLGGLILEKSDASLTYNLYVDGSNSFAVSKGASQFFTVDQSGNAGIGISTPTAKLQVRGSGATSSTTSLLVQNSSATGILQVRDDGVILMGGYSMNTNNGSLSISYVSGNGFNLTNYGYLGPSNIVSSAILQADSTTRGFLLPRTNLTSNISAPAQGLQTYITSSATEGIWYYNSGSYQGWTRVLNNTGSQSISGSFTVVGASNLGGATFSNGGASFANNVNLGAITEGGAGNSWINLNGTRVHIGQNGNSAGLNVVSATQYVGIGKDTPNTTLDVLGNITVTGSINATGALTASSAVISGNVTVLGTASINTLIVNQTQLSTGSNQLGDAADDFQTLYGTVTIPTGSLTVSGSITQNVSTASFGGLVGIGTSSPAVGLDVRNGFNLWVGGGHYLEGIAASGTDASLVLRRTANNGWVRYALGATASVSFGANMSTGEVQLMLPFGGFFQTFYANGSEAMRIPTSRNVLIGTTTDAGYKLDVNGTTRTSGLLTATNGITVSGGNSNVYGLTFNSGGIPATGQGLFTDGKANIQQSQGQRSIDGGYAYLFTAYLGATYDTIQPSANRTTNCIVVGGTYGDTNTTSIRLNMFHLNHTYNFTNAATYTVRGIYYNPTLTSMTNTTHRAIETTSGDIIFGGNTAVTITGSFTVVTGSSIEFQVNQTGVKIGNATTDSHSITGSVAITASAGTGSALLVYKSGSTVLDVQGSSGQLFSVTDSLTGSLFSVNTVAGLPVIEAFSDNTVNIGKYGTYPIKVVSLGTSAIITGSFSGSLTGVANTASFALTASYVNPLVQNVLVTGSVYVSQSIYGGDKTLLGSNVNNGSLVFTQNGSNEIQSSQYLYITRIGNNGFLQIRSWSFVDIDSSLGVGLNAQTPSARLHVKGSGTTSATTAFRVENTNASASLLVYDDNRTELTQNTGYNSTITDGALVLRNPNNLSAALGVTSDGILRVKLNTGGGINFTAGSDQTLIQGNRIFSFNTALRIGGNLSNSTSATNSSVLISDTITMVNSAHRYNALSITTPASSSITNGLVRGLFINPTFSGSVDYRSIETTAGNILFQSGSSPLLFVSESGNVGIGTTTPSTSLQVNGDTILSSSLYSSRQSSSLNAGDTLLYQVNTGSYTAGFFDYYAVSGSNGRAGTIMSFWLGGQVQYTDNSTPDVGNTSNIAFSMSLAGSSAQLFASASSAGWNVKTSFRTI